LFARTREQNARTPNKTLRGEAADTPGKLLQFVASHQIMFLETRHFHDFASRNHENDVSLKIIFCRRRRQKTFYTTRTTLPKIISPDNIHLNKYIFSDFFSEKF
jgi:hypothetical protein